MQSIQVLQIPEKSHPYWAADEYLADSERRTYLGELLQRTNLDSSAELCNVLDREIGLVYPLLLLMEHLKYNSETQKNPARIAESSRPEQSRISPHDRNRGL